MIRMSEVLLNDFDALTVIAASEMTVVSISIFWIPTVEIYREKGPVFIVDTKAWQDLVPGKFPLCSGRRKPLYLIVVEFWGFRVWEVDSSDLQCMLLLLLRFRFRFCWPRRRWCSEGLLG